MNMINILHKFIRAKSIGNWELYLQSIQAMFPCMTTSGHNSYTISGMLYLQQMSNLSTQCPDVQQHFSEGLHVIQKATTCRHAGLSSDLVIEQFWWEVWRSVEVSHHGIEWLKVSTYCNWCQGLPVQKLTRQCRRSLGLTTVLGSRIRIWQQQDKHM